jgi:protocatechuate 3,4-dioxygenase beta subunit
VDEIAHKHASESGAPTSSSILGPFWSPHAPFRDAGDTIVRDPAPGGLVTLMHGKVIDLETKKGIPNAVVDIWQASSNGKYDFQDPDNQTPNNLRGKFRCDENGDYHFYCLRPTAYSLPTDGPSWTLLQMLDRHPMRPAHIHLMITADNYKSVVTQIFPSDDPWLKTDTVFAVKDDLVVDFNPSKDPKAERDLELNITLALKPVPGDSAPAPHGKL